MITRHDDSKWDLVQLMDLLQVQRDLPHDPHRTSTLAGPIAHRTGDAYYDEWLLDDRYRGTELGRLWDTLDRPGQARVIMQPPGRAYMAHADVDDRYHINLTGSESYLIDLDQGRLHPCRADGRVYRFQASMAHTAANFGNEHRAQLVIKQRLAHNTLTDPVPTMVRLRNRRDYHQGRYGYDLRMLAFIGSGSRLGVITAFQGDVAGSYGEDYRDVDGDPNTFTVGFEMEASLRTRLEEVASTMPVDIRYDVDYRSLTRPA
jgi:uncharacterized cupin superfamily protein